MTAQEVLKLIQRAKYERARELDLSNKNLTEIPPEIPQLTSLQHLYLSDNQISEIPEALAQLTSLQRLYLSDNQISEIPEAHQRDSRSARSTHLPATPLSLQ